MLSSSSMGTENFRFPKTCKLCGAEGSLPNKSRKVSWSIGMETETRLTMLVSGGFFMFSFPAISTASVCHRPGDPITQIKYILVSNLVSLVNHGRCWSLDLAFHSRQFKQLKSNSLENAFERLVLDGHLCFLHGPSCRRLCRNQPNELGHWYQFFYLILWKLRRTYSFSSIIPQSRVFKNDCINKVGRFI